MSSGLSLPSMGRALVLVSPSRSFFSTLLSSRVQFHRLYSTLEPPNVGRLAETARISLAPDQLQEFGPKITRVVDWFGQLQAVDLESIEPAIRAETEGGNLRDDWPENFDNREEIITALPIYEEPYIKVPKILNRE